MRKAKFLAALLLAAVAVPAAMPIAAAAADAPAVSDPAMAAVLADARRDQGPRAGCTPPSGGNDGVFSGSSRA